MTATGHADILPVKRCQLKGGELGVLTSVWEVEPITLSSNLEGNQCTPKASEELTDVVHSAKVINSLVASELLYCACVAENEPQVLLQQPQAAINEGAQPQEVKKGADRVKRLPNPVEASKDFPAPLEEKVGNVGECCNRKERTEEQQVEEGFVVSLANAVLHKLAVMIHAQ